MIWKTLNGRTKDIKIHRYLVDFDGDQGSRFSEEVLDFLYPYWRHDVVCCELPVPATLMRFDYVNVSKRIICETDGIQHSDPHAYHNKGSRAVWLAQIKRDVLKDQIAELNGFKMVRINPEDMPLSRQFFKRQFDIDL